MAETLISPGVLARETDNSFLRKQPVNVGAAIIGPTVKGPVENPQIVTSYNEYQNKFGTKFTSGSDTYTYFTSITAYNYFNNGGKSLLVARVASGSFTEASSSFVSGSTSASVASGSAFVLETLGEGIMFNSSGSEDSSGSLISGSSSNFRWQIVNSDTASGTFAVLIRQGNDNTNTPIILETWTNLSLDPLSTNFISKVIGDQKENYNSTNNQMDVSGSFPNNSQFVRVKKVNNLTPNYFDNNGVAKAEFTAYIPINTSGSFGGASGNIMGEAQFFENITDGNKSQGIPSASYDNMINLLSNKDDYQFNVLLTPGLFNTLQTSEVTSIITNTQQRGDNIYVVDLVPFGSTVTTVSNNATTRDTSYAAAYWPWVQVIDPDSGKNVWVPASTVVGGVYANNDVQGETWTAPAGINRGGLQTVLRPEQKLNQTNRDTLYSKKVNPIASFPGTGIVVYGQKTLQTKASALDRVNVRRLLISLKSFITQVGQTLVFDGNTNGTRNQFLNTVNPYMENVQQRDGLYAFKVIMDSSNNTGDVIDRNQMIGQIFVQPTKTAEFIYLDFNISPTGTTFPA